METKGTARTRANNKYNAKAYDRVALMVKKGKREELKSIAESLNTFINKAIEERIEREA